MATLPAFTATELAYAAPTLAREPQPAASANDAANASASASAQDVPGADPPASPPAQDAQLAALLEQAAQALADDRLTVPRGDSAYDFLRQAQQLDPDHPAIDEGLDEVAARYGVLARWWIRKGDYGKGMRLIERGLRVRPRHAALRALRQEMHALVLQGEQPSPFPSAFDDSSSPAASGGSRSSDGAVETSSEPDREPEPNLLNRLRALLRGESGEAP